MLYDFNQTHLLPPPFFFDVHRFCLGFYTNLTKIVGRAGRGLLCRGLDQLGEGARELVLTTTGNGSGNDVGLSTTAERNI